IQRAFRESRDTFRRRTQTNVPIKSSTKRSPMSDPEVRPPHTMLGVFASIVGVFAGFLEVVSFIALALMRTGADAKAAQTICGVVMLTGVGSAVFGLFLALISMFFYTRKTFAVLGLLINGLIVLAF